MKTQIWPDLEPNMSSGCVSPGKVTNTGTNFLPVLSIRPKAIALIVSN
jgi:hypothetical protein